MGNFYMESTQINYRRDEKLKTVDQKLQELSETSAIDTDIAPVFKSTNTYHPGDMVYYRNKLYVFNVEHTGSWAAADVTATDVTTEISSLKSGLTNYQAQNNLNLEVPNRKNLFDKDNADNLTGKALNSETGVPYIASGWMTSNFIEIEPSTTYTLTTASSSSSVAFYDSEQVYISGASSFGTKKTPSNAKYLRFDYKTDDAAIMQLELGSTATAYAHYIPSVESRIEAVESAIKTYTSNPQLLTQGAETLCQITVDVDPTKYMWMASINSGDGDDYVSFLTISAIYTQSNNQVIVVISQKARDSYSSSYINVNLVGIRKG